MKRIVLTAVLATTLIGGCASLPGMAPAGPTVNQAASNMAVTRPTANSIVRQSPYGNLANMVKVTKDWTKGDGTHCAQIRAAIAGNDYNTYRRDGVVCAKPGGVYAYHDNEVVPADNSAPPPKKAKKKKSA